MKTGNKETVTAAAETEKTAEKEPLDAKRDAPDAVGRGLVSPAENNGHTQDDGKDAAGAGSHPGPEAKDTQNTETVDETSAPDAVGRGEDDPQTDDNAADTNSCVKGRDGTRPLRNESNVTADENDVPAGESNVSTDENDVPAGENDVPAGEQAPAIQEENTDLPDPFESALFDRWDREIAEAEVRYTGFDMRREMADPRFARMAVAAGVCEAYETVHRRELDARLCAAAYRLASEAAAEKISANLARPAEGGLARTAAPLVKVDPRHLTSEQRLDVRRRLKGGEHITF